VFAFRSDTRSRCHTVSVMLAAWMFALTAGVINACVLNLPSAATPGSFVQSQVAHLSWAAADTEHDNGGPLTHDEHKQNGANDSCLKFCDDESSALFKGNTSSTFDPGAALVATVQLPGAVVPIAHVGTGRSPQQPTAQGPPLVIRLLRLTL
jgi:hypothetical protein